MVLESPEHLHLLLPLGLLSHLGRIRGLILRGSLVLRLPLLVEIIYFLLFPLLFLHCLDLSLQIRNVVLDLIQDLIRLTCSRRPALRLAQHFVSRGFGLFEGPVLGT